MTLPILLPGYVGLPAAYRPCQSRTLVYCLNISCHSVLLCGLLLDSKYLSQFCLVNFEFLATLFFGIILFIATQSSIEALLDYPHRINVWILHVVHFSGKSYIKNFSTYSINVYYVMSITCKATLYSLYVYASIHWIIFFQHKEISV